MKKVLLFAVAAAMFAACSSSDDVANSAPQNPDQDFTQGTQAVGFDVYVNRATGHRAGAHGDALAADLADHATNLGASGFGVFAYYTDNNDYDQTAIPNFMYNQRVKIKDDDSGYEYTPLKYWPNEYGTNATSDDFDKVSFFAYLPWVETDGAGKVNTASAVTETNPTETTGIVGLSRNNVAGDPLVKYVVAFDDPAKCVDLCWATTGASAITWSIDNTGTQTIPALFPWLNVQRPAATSADKLKFDFQHALSALNVQVKTSINLDVNTKVFIRSITFSGFAEKGALNLNNTTASKALWLDFNGASEIQSAQEITIYDGQKDGKEATTANSSEKRQGLNPAFIQTYDFSDASIQAGVTGTYANLFNSATATTPIYVIPTGEQMTVTIVYEVLTADSNLAAGMSGGTTKGSVVKNTITKKIKMNSGADDFVLESGKKHTVNLILGMRDVQFDATVTAWSAGTDADDTDLPKNN